MLAIGSPCLGVCTHCDPIMSLPDGAWADSLYTLGHTVRVVVGCMQGIARAHKTHVSRLDAVRLITGGGAAAGRVLAGKRVAVAHMLLPRHRQHPHCAALLSASGCRHSTRAGNPAGPCAQLTKAPRSTDKNAPRALHGHTRGAAPGRRRGGGACEVVLWQGVVAAAAPPAV
jgi:hypothetical protein